MKIKRHVVSWQLAQYGPNIESKDILILGRDAGLYFKEGYSNIQAMYNRYYINI